MSRLYIALCALLMCHAVVAHEVSDDVQSMMHHVVDIGIRKNCISDAEQKIYRKFVQDGVVDKNQWKQLYKIIARIMKHADHGRSKQECKQLLKEMKHACVCQTRQADAGIREPVQASIALEDLDVIDSIIREKQSFAGPFAVAFGNQSAGFNFAAGDDPTALAPPQGGVATSTNSYGFNFAARNGQAISSNGSDGFNFASSGGEATSSDNAGGFNFASTGLARSSDASGFNFASFAGVATGSDGSNGFNFAAGDDPTISVSPQGGVATSTNSYGFNFAVRNGQAISSNESDGFNFASTSGEATSTNNSDGFNFAAREGEATSSDDASGFNFAAGDNPFLFTSQGGIATSTNSYGFNFAVRDSQAISSDRSDGFNFASRFSEATSSDSAGFNFASSSGEATSSDSAGFNFASSSGEATSSESSGFNFASRLADAMSSDNSAGFNFAAISGEATSSDSNGFNFASSSGLATSSAGSNGFNFAGQSTTCSSADTAFGMNFVTGFGRDGFGFPQNPASISTTGDSANDNDLLFFNVAVGENTSITVNRQNGNNNVAEAVIIATNGASVDTTASGNNYGDGVNIDVGSGELRLFNLNTTGTGNPLEIGANGVVHDTSSTRHHKADIRSPDRNVIDKLMQLRSVQFARRGGEDSHEYGLIAEEVAHILRDIVVYDADGTPHGICYRQLTPLLLTAIQQQQHENQELRDMVHELREQDAQRQHEIERLYQMVGALQA